MSSIPDLRFKRISIGKAGVWAVHENMNIYEIKNGYPITNIPGHLVHVSVGDSIWGVNKDGKIFTCPGNGNNSWREIPGILNNIDVSNKGSVWGVNKWHHIFKMDGGSWARIAGPDAVQVSVGESGVWLVDIHGDIHYRTGTFGDDDMDNSIGTAKWTKIDGTLKWVASGQNIVCGVNDSDETVYRAGVTENTPTGTDWRKVKGSKAYESFQYSQLDVYGRFIIGRTSSSDIFYTLLTPAK